MHCIASNGYQLPVQDQYQIVVDGVVYGEIAFKNEFIPQFDTKLPDMPNTLWYGDGTKLNLYYKDYDKKHRNAWWRVPLTCVPR